MPKRVGVAIQAAFALFLVSSLVAFFLLRKDPEMKTATFMLVISIPAISSLAVVALIAAIDALLPGERLAFPSNLTLPIMHVALMAVLIKLMATTPNPLEAVPDQFAPALVWERWSALLASLVGEILILSLMLLARAPKESE
jgi:hypothetical protein